MSENPYTTPDPSRSALLTIDMQQDFSVPGAPSYVEGTDAVVSPIQRLLGTFRAQGQPIIHVVRLYRSDGSNVDACRRRHIEKGNRVVAPGTTGAELVDRLKPTPDVTLNDEALLAGRLQPLAEREWIMYKPRWGAFFETPLDEFLRGRDLNSVVVTGCNFPNCPRTTVYEASERDYRVVLVPGAVSGTYARGLRELENIGVHLMTANECDDWLTRQETPVQADTSEWSPKRE